jgi:hypothetical protein
MSVYGFIGGLGQGLADTGKAMQTDALEARRQQRLEEARVKQEQRANMEWDRRDTIGRERAIEDRDEGRQFTFGSSLPDVQQKGQFNFELGARNNAALDLYSDKARANNQINRFGTPYFDETTGGLLQSGPDGQVRNIASARATGAAGDEGPKPAGATELNHAYRVLSEAFGGKHDQFGNVIKPPDAPEKVAMAYEIAVDLMEPPEGSGRQPMTLGQATAQAQRIVESFPSRKDALDQATQEAANEKFGWGGGSDRRAWIERRQSEILENAQKEIDQVMGRSSQTQGSAPPASSPSSPSQGYPEGTRLRGADGKTYVVRGGIPVLEQ